MKMITEMEFVRNAIPLLFQSQILVAKMFSGETYFKHF